MAAGGGSGVSGGGVSTFQPIEGANVRLPTGDQVDLSTAEGVAAAEAALDPEQLAELEQMMKGMGFERAGNTFVPRDDYQIRRELGIVGPSSTSSGMTDLDAEIGEQVFEAHGFPNPYNANTTEALYGQIKDSESFKAAVEASNNNLANPNKANTTEFITRMNVLMDKYPHGNVMELLFTVFRESIEATNEDKKYFLLKLQEFNKMAEKISVYLHELNEASMRLSEACEGQKYPEKVHIDVDVKNFDLTALDPNGELAGAPVAPKATGFEGYNSFDEYFEDKKDDYAMYEEEDLGEEGSEQTLVGYDEETALKDYTEGKELQAQRAAEASDGIVTRSLDREGLNSAIKECESMQETIRNKRQMASTAFQNFDQKANQLFNLMASVMKSMKEMREGAVRNML